MLIWEDRKREINEEEGEMKKGKREEGRRRKRREGGRKGHEERETVVGACPPIYIYNRPRPMQSMANPHERLND